MRLSDRMLRDATAIAERTDVLDVERWASGWLGQAWVGAALGEREPEKQLCLEVVGRANTRPSPTGLAAVTALRRVAPPSEASMLDGSVAILAEGQPPPPWSDAPRFTPVRSWRAVDVWDSERVLFVEYAPEDALATAHTLMARIVEPGGTVVAKLGVLYPDAAHRWASTREDGDVPMPLAECPVEEALADLASGLRRTDLLWPRHDDADFVEVRALAWTRCRAYLPGWPNVEPLPDDERRTLVDAFLVDAGVPDPEADLADPAVVRSLASLFLDYGEGYITAGPLAWSPDSVLMFLVDWLPRKAFLDEGQKAALPETLRRWLSFALRRRRVDPQWVEPVVSAVDTYLPDFTEAVDDESSWGPAKQIAAELGARGIDLSDKAAVDAVIGELNAQRLARRLLDE